MERDRSSSREKTLEIDITGGPTHTREGTPCFTDVAVNDPMVLHVDSVLPLTTCKNDGEHCPVCDEAILRNTQVRKYLCGHIFHPKCITAWVFYKLAVDESPSCPICRSPLFIPPNSPIPRSVMVVAVPKTRRVLTLALAEHPRLHGGSNIIHIEFPRRLRLLAERID